MSDTVWQVQLHIFQSIKSNQYLIDKKIPVFHQIPKNTPFPYIYLGKFSVSNDSLKGLIRLRIYSEIHFYAQDMTIEKILMIEESIKVSLTQSNVFLKNCHIGQILFKSMELDIMPDAKTYRAVSKFEIKVEEIYQNSELIKE